MRGKCTHVKLFSSSSLWRTRTLLWHFLVRLPRANFPCCSSESWQSKAERSRRQRPDQQKWTDFQSDCLFELIIYVLWFGMLTRYACAAWSKKWLKSYSAFAALNQYSTEEQTLPPCRLERWLWKNTSLLKYGSEFKQSSNILDGHWSPMTPPKVRFGWRSGLWRLSLTVCLSLNSLIQEEKLSFFTLVL